MTLLTTWRALGRLLGHHRQRPRSVLVAQLLLVVAAALLLQSAVAYGADTEWRRLTGEGEFLYKALLYATAAATAVGAVIGLRERRRWAPTAGVAVVVVDWLFGPVWLLLDPQVTVSFQPIWLTVDVVLAVALLASLLLPATRRWCDQPTPLLVPAPGRPAQVTRTLFGMVVVALVFLFWNPLLVEQAFDSLSRYGEDRTVTADVMIAVSVLTGLGYLVSIVALRAGRSWPRWFVPALAAPATAVGGYLAFGLGLFQNDRLGYQGGRYVGFGFLAIVLAASYIWWVRTYDTEYWLDHLAMSRDAGSHQPPGRE